jgi:hypothetical protein
MSCAQVNPTYRGDQGTSRSSLRTDEDEKRELICSDRRTRCNTSTASQEIFVEAELCNKATQRVIWLPRCVVSP